MAEIKNCLLPDELYYHVDYNLWVRGQGDGTYEVGMTDIAQSMAGALLHCRMKKVGKSVKEGKSLATVESGKWVGPLKSPFACEVVARNEAVEVEAAILNRSPYKEGWIVRVRPAEGVDVAASLVRGEEAVAGFTAYMAANELEECIHCEGFEG